MNVNKAHLIKVELRVEVPSRAFQLKNQVDFPKKSHYNINVESESNDSNSKYT